MNKEELERTVSAVVEQAVAEQVNLERLGLARIEPGASLVDDLGIDSVELLTVIYDIEVALKISIPVGQWLKEAGAGDGSAGFTVRALVSRIVEHLQQPAATAA